MLNARLVEKGKQFDIDAVAQQGVVTHKDLLYRGRRGRKPAPAAPTPAA